ncbi:hypothetical protein ACLKA6_013724 [Drosophila palustris]
MWENGRFEKTCDKKFTTYDSDNDDDANKNCGNDMGAWWYGQRLYGTGNSTEEPQGGVKLSSDINHEMQSGESNSNILRLYDLACPTYSNSNGITTIEVPGLEPFEVLCNSDLAGPGWTVIASRSSSDLNFFRNWTEYKRGFGSLTGDFFVGLDKLHAITVSRKHELYISLEDFDGNKRFARYDEFLIGNEADKYVMAKLGKYVGDMGDSLTYHAKMKFSTYDNDSSQGNCAVVRMGAGWYNNCYNSATAPNYSSNNLFGLYLNGSHRDILKWKGMYWYSWRGAQYSNKVMSMMSVLVTRAARRVRQ